MAQGQEVQGQAGNILGAAALSSHLLGVRQGMPSMCPPQSGSLGPGASL